MSVSEARADVAKSRQEAANLESRLLDLETKYSISSAEFMRHFQAGEMGDSADMFEWSAFYQMWLSPQERVRLLEAQAV